MGHEHGSAHGHTHAHGHHHAHGHTHPSSDREPLPPALDLTVPTSELAPAAVDRRRFLRSAGLLGAGAAALGVAASTGVGSAAASPLGGRGNGRIPRGGYTWLAGDHHIHTQYSSDGQYRVIDQVRHANAYGLDWMVITDHGSETHARIGVEKVNPDITAARKDTPDTLVFQGLEWNIPSAEHGTVFVHPGRNEVAVLKQFETDYDGSPLATAELNEQRAVQGLHFLADSVSARRVQDALMLANHPSRKGVDSPHEIRGWRDAEPRIAIGMEGAPGHQAGGMPKAYGPGGGRGLYDGSPAAGSFPGYPLESYRTFGGFDWMTSTVGGLWDSLLAEGKPWWITANSDSHAIYADTSVRGENTFATAGRYGEPTYRTAGPNLGNSDFWPGYYSRTHVGAKDFSYAAVMDGMRAGRVWVDHGRLLESLDVRLRAGNKEVPLGGMLTARRGSEVELVITVVPADTPNWSELLPRLAKIDVIRGAVTGAVRGSDRDVFTAPRTRVDKTFDVRGRSGEIRLSWSLGRLDEACYVRLRGSDGNRLAPGLMGAAVDPAGPAQDVVGDADPWQDLWFYTNPMWAIPT